MRLRRRLPSTPSSASHLRPRVPYFAPAPRSMPDNLTGAIMVSAVYRVLNPMEPLYCWK